MQYCFIKFNKNNALETFKDKFLAQSEFLTLGEILSAFVNQPNGRMSRYHSTWSPWEQVVISQKKAILEDADTRKVQVASRQSSNQVKLQWVNILTFSLLVSGTGRWYHTDCSHIPHS